MVLFIINITMTNMTMTVLLNIIKLGLFDVLRDDTMEEFVMLHK